jgi:hypothetical protein
LQWWMLREKSKKEVPSTITFQYQSWRGVVCENIGWRNVEESGEFGKLNAKTDKSRSFLCLLRCADILV